MVFQLSDCQNVLVVGAGHGIGLALVQNLLLHHPKIQVYCTYRVGAKADSLFELRSSFPQRVNLFNLDPTQDSNLMELALDFKNKGIALDLIINSVGLLHDERIRPEKSLRSFDQSSFLEMIRVNALVTPLLAKNFESLLNPSKVSALVTLSAKVGSIEDNRLGGWYSYRASKAALNMLIKTIAIEFTRKKKNCLLLAVHPGTTKTELSRPYTANTSYQLHSPAESAQNILALINGRDILDTGTFFSWDRQEIPW